MAKVLVVEDNPANMTLATFLLESAGHTSLRAVDAEAGIALASSEQPDLILMDIQMPVLDGYAATRRIKALPELRDTPIIVVTSYALSGDDVKAREAGADGYVSKPFSPRELLAKIRQFLP
jgi:two-component system cell cycle response regulator DivK